MQVSTAEFAGMEFMEFVSLRPKLVKFRQPFFTKTLFFALFHHTCVFRPGLILWVKNLETFSFCARNNFQALPLHISHLQCHSLPLSHTLACRRPKSYSLDVRDLNKCHIVTINEIFLSVKMRIMMPKSSFLLIVNHISNHNVCQKNLNNLFFMISCSPNY